VIQDANRRRCQRILVVRVAERPCSRRWPVCALSILRGPLRGCCDLRVLSEHDHTMAARTPWRAVPAPRSGPCGRPRSPMPFRPPEPDEYRRHKSTRARGSTLRRRIVNIPARLVRLQRRPVLHLPNRWPWSKPGSNGGATLFGDTSPLTATTRPPAEEAPPERTGKAGQTSSYTSPSRDPQHRRASTTTASGSRPNPRHATRSASNWARGRADAHKAQRLTD
jgi:hypothetical protein